MSKRGQEIGRWGEELAASYLEAKGYTVLARNLRFAEGEIDLVTVHQEAGETSLVFVEVKTRTTRVHGYPEEAFSRSKYSHLLAAIQDYLAANQDLQYDWRLDLIAILGDPREGQPQISHFKGVVMLDDRE